MKVPLKTILKSFLDHVEDLETRRKLYDDQYETEFQELKKLSEKLREDPQYTSSCGLKDVNRPKNRYKDIVPYDFSRVVLPKYEGIPGSDYINASYIKGASGAFAYIAAQGPLPNTVVDFWRMIWICDVQVVVMACNEREAGKYKCETYWPADGGVSKYGNISVELVKSCQVCSEFLVRTLLVKCDNEMRDVYQFHYTSWPDHGVPETVQPILDLVRLMRDCQASETVPILVHCSAGCGRTGTICAVDYVWACLRHGKLEADFSLYQIALDLRRQRIAMIQTKEQYILAHKAVATMFEQQLKVIDCHIYENIDEDGEPLMWKEVNESKSFRPDKKPNKDTKRENHVPPSILNSCLKLETMSKADTCNSKEINHSSQSCENKNSAPSENVNISSKNSESSYSRNSILSQHSNEDSIPFIDDDDVCIRPNCGRAYLDIPSCDSISKLINCFDPFVDKVSLGTDDSSPDGDPPAIAHKMNLLASCSKTLDKDTKLHAYKERDSVEMDAKSEIIVIDRDIKTTAPNRESYPPCVSKDSSQKVMSVIDEQTGEDKTPKKVGRATVVRRPSISKLKALFEKSGISSNKCSDSSKGVFRNNSHHVSRAGSAPPSLNCMDKTSSVERESILMMVTKKFRSSSVRTERELQSKDKAPVKKSAAETVKGSLSALSRTMSFNINRTFKSYSPTKLKVEENTNSTAPVENLVGVYKPKSPDYNKGNSVWYDKSTVTRAIAIVKPTEKAGNNESNISSKSPSSPMSPDNSKASEPHFSYNSKTPKFRDFFSSLNRKDAKDSSTMWYNEANSSANSKSISQSSTVFPMETSKNLPFLPFPSLKKVGLKSPINSPEPNKNFSDIALQPNSKFYANISDSICADKATKRSPVIDHTCPIPEEIIPLDPDAEKHSFWPSSSLLVNKSESNSLNEKPSENVTNAVLTLNKIPVDSKSVSNIPELKPDVPPAVSKRIQPSVIEKDIAENSSEMSPTDRIISQSSKTHVSPDIPKLVTSEIEKNLIQLSNQMAVASNMTSQTIKSGIPPAILKKIEPSESETNLVQVSNELSVPSKVSETLKSDIPPAIPKKMVIGKNKNLNFQENKNEPDDSFISKESNVQNTVAKEVDKTNKWGAEEGKKDMYMNVNIKAIKNLEQIENTLRKNPRAAIIDLTSRESYSMEEELVNAVNQLSKTSEKSNCDSILNSKLGSQNQNAVQNKDSVLKSSKYPGYEVIWPEHPTVSDVRNKHHQNKTGVCYSPPLKRNSNRLSLAKSLSCGSLDWMETKEPSQSNKRETCDASSKKLVKEAVVEFNTLLNQLTTRTLSEDISDDSKNENKVTNESNIHDQTNCKTSLIENDTIVHSVTLITKSCTSGSSPKEEEIVFHFPPPPRNPPPKDDLPIESFDILRKDGSWVVKEVCKRDDTTSISESFELPQPAPRKPKNCSIQRSSSYANISPFRSGYENVFPEKFQTLSRLDPKSEYENIFETVVPVQKIPPMSLGTQNVYVNVNNVNYINTPLEQASIRTQCSNEHKSNSASSTFVKDASKSSNANNSIYGKIHKPLDRDTATKTFDVNPLSVARETKKKPSPSKKTERAPPPPTIKPVQMLPGNVSNSSSSVKKIPSRKLEKAPLPPHLLQKSASAKNVQKLQKSLYENFSSVNTETKQHLPSVVENISSTVNNFNIEKAKLVSKDKFINHGLSHSQSDVSVYLALKERKFERPESFRKIPNIKSNLLNKMPNSSRDMISVSSSDSDSSCERTILAEKYTDFKHDSVGKSLEQSYISSNQSSKKEVPVAPPRSKRRSTTEVQYTQVKTKDPSLIKSAVERLHLKAKQQSSTDSKTSDDEPPALPVKTKDAFEIPEDCHTKM